MALSLTVPQRTGRVIASDLDVRVLGACRHPSPLASRLAQSAIHYVGQADRVLLDDRLSKASELRGDPSRIPAFELAGPRDRIFFDPGKLRVGIVTCGGLCPGINNVIRGLVLELTQGYGVSDIFGFRYGYGGLVGKNGHGPITMTAASVADIHHGGGTALGTSRGDQDAREMVDRLDQLDIGILFVVGGDGTLRGAMKLVDEIGRRDLAHQRRRDPEDHRQRHPLHRPELRLRERVLRRGRRHPRRARRGHRREQRHRAWSSSWGGTRASSPATRPSPPPTWTRCSSPRCPVQLEGDGGLLRFLERRLEKDAHALIVVAEGAGQELCAATGRPDQAPKTDPSGNAAPRRHRGRAARSRRRPLSRAAHRRHAEVRGPELSHPQRARAPHRQPLLLEHGSQRRARGDGGQYRDAHRPMARTLRPRPDAAGHAIPQTSRHERRPLDGRRRVDGATVVMDAVRRATTRPRAGRRAAKKPAERTRASTPPAVDDEASAARRHPHARAACSATPSARHEGRASTRSSRTSGSTAVRFRRYGDTAARSRAGRRRLNALDVEPAISVVRAFSYFSHLANIAEDQHTNRMLPARRSSRASRPQRGRWRSRIERLKAREDQGGRACARCSTQALVSPVLTAHPTEVQRKSILDREVAIARLLDRARPGAAHGARGAREQRSRAAPRGQHDVGDADAPPREAHGLRRDRERARLLSATRSSRRSRASTRDIEDLLDTEFADVRSPGSCRPSCASAAGSAAIATATRSSTRDVLLYAVKQQSRVAFELLPRAGARASAPSCRSRRTSSRSRRSCETSPRASADRSEQRLDEPYRRVLVGIYARLAATAERLNGQQALRHPAAKGKPYANATEFADATSRPSARRSWPTAGPRPRAGGCATLIHAARAFRFHLAPVDLRQNSDVHERVVAELFACAGVARRLPDARPRRPAAWPRCRGARDDAAARLALPPRTPTRPRASSPSSAPRARSSWRTGRRRCPTTSSRRPTRRPTCSR